MRNYILRRLLLIIPTLLGVMFINFLIVQFTPGGPVERMAFLLQSHSTVSATDRFTGSGGDAIQSKAGADSFGKNTFGLEPEIYEEIKKQFGFDKPAHIRFINMIKNYALFDFGDSLYRNISVLGLVKEKLPVSITLGLWSTLIIYLVCIPLGVQKALKHGSKFDVWTSTVVIVANAIPGFLLGILLIVLFAGGSYFDWFPLRGLTSENFDELSVFGKIKDYFWHITLPLVAYTIGGFATLTMLTKNSFLDEINKQYVVTAKAKGLTDKAVLYGHIFRNAMLIVIASFPAAFVGIFIGGSLLVEVIFSLDGIGLLSYEAIVNRDYPVVFGTLYIFSLIGLLLKVISDVTYHLIDPRINFDKQS